MAIARALLAQPEVLIFDEATSNLDTESEQMIQAALRKLVRGRTTFVIAHRLSTIADADLIIVIDDGQIIESGSHTELLEAGGSYAAMVRRQHDWIGGNGLVASGG
jgi:ATP-binding cassette subfamily B protein/subfamily B ATP-binding cassette protein MsbA